MEFDINKFIDSVAAQKDDALRNFFHEEAVIFWHVTNEKFNVDEFIRVTCDYPGDWVGSVVCTNIFANTIMSVAKLCSKDDGDQFITSFISLKDNKIIQLDEYLADVSKPPKWRQIMNIGTKIN